MSKNEIIPISDLESISILLSTAEVKFIENNDPSIKFIVEELASERRFCMGSKIIHHNIYIYISGLCLDFFILYFIFIFIFWNSQKNNFRRWQLYRPPSLFPILGLLKGLPLFKILVNLIGCTRANF